MNWNQFFFVIFPYIAITIFIVATVYRSVFRPFTLSSLSSQLLERKYLYWGNVPFHYGILFVLLGHLLAMLFPRGLMIWNSIPIRLYLLELTGFLMGLWSLAGITILIWRRIRSANIRAVTQPTDMLVLFLLFASILTGAFTAVTYRFGSLWFTGAFTPYLWSILLLQPRPDLIAPLPSLIQFHALNFFVLLAIFPFTRLIHIITMPLDYLFRPWQIVIAMRNRREAAQISNNES
mgnify:CR=1 FL=1